MYAIFQIDRFSTVTLVSSRCEWWAEEDHPYFANYKAQAQCLLVDLAAEHSISRFVRLTVLSLGYSAFNPVGKIFCSLLSLTTRHHFLCEQYLRNSSVPYVILRPGGLADEDRVSNDGKKAYSRA
jgi:hypothetical protein